MLEELLQRIEKMEKNIELLLELHFQQSNSLTTYTDVARFLGKTRKTIYHYVRDGKFEENIHYYKDDNNKIVFIPEGIIDYKSNLGNKKRELKFEKPITKKEPKRVVHPKVTSMLKGVA